VTVAAALAHRLVVFGLAVTAAAGLLAAAVDLVDGCPGAPFSFVGGEAAFLVAFLDMLSLAFLVVGVFALVAARHGTSVGRPKSKRNASHR
jgi:hypothetical protein